MTKTRQHIVTFYMTTCMVIFFLPLSAFAEETTQKSTYLNQMNDAIFYWYLFIRNNIAFPLITISCGLCGFRLLSSCFLSSTSSVDVQSIRKQAYYTFLAFFVLMLLPSVIGEVKDMFANTGWTPANVTPPTTSVPT